ncbi:MAG TPA: hypothetical protein ENI23_07270 [bacterium]|nr:hypothetical protein [bacterium]
MTKIKETKKQRFKPWNKSAKADLEHSLLQIEKDLLLKKQSVHILEIGQIDLDEEIEGYIGEARLELKKAELNLEKMEFDKTNNITKKETLFALDEAKREVKRMQHNFDAINNQIKNGQPILEDLNPNAPVATEPDAVNKKAQEECADKEEGPKSQEEANEIAGEDEAKAAQGE